MKTNHQRDFIDPGSFKAFCCKAVSRKLEEKAVQSKTVGNDFCCGHRGAARAKSGAKKYVRVQERREGRRLIKRTLEEAIMFPYLNDKNASIKAVALGQTVKIVFKEMLQGNIIDLTGLDPEKVNGMHLAVILRATWTRQYQVIGWHEALLVAQAAIRRDGLDDADALAGILQESK